ncbi:aminoacyl-histidine dipeptidase [Ferrigenium kumadai]|uniref:Cytosol non-specific dipeptidase n=1 Tax=Ferrigenium kumadai TaxID=1682490 RepID=A0AAN1VZT9_9PROT|nr:aminoacyl-histidine dipeptidase [Ferrigenium kumadai]BBI98567.1 aminoacyl-histidine dipeptidase [Ferrigenium kumadai]
MTTNTDLNNLQPSSVWAHFATLCAIPRPSYHEAALIEHLIAWANAHGIESFIDGAGNLILKKPASPGGESMPGVVLQGHLDMVCQANAGTVHDFERDAIDAVVRDGWVVAEGTTLGADNGIGVALALAVLEEPGLAHPPLEVLLTVNEESGMDGARGLAPGTLQGKTLINLDTEEWGHFYLGCAGGVDVEVRHDCARDNVPADYALVRFEVSGLRGGHSGIDIHLVRGNAIKLLAEALHDLSSHTDLRLVEMKGGTARNAIPREAYAVCALPAVIAASLDEWVQHRHESWKQRYAGSDANVSFVCRHDDTPPGMSVSPTEQERLLAFLDTAASGVSRVSEDFPGVTDTSSNLGVVAFEKGAFKATFKVRSLHDARADALADKLAAHAASYGLQAWKDGAYPGWTPNPSSRLLALCQRVYTAQFGQPAGLQVIHAGLECGLLAASHPHLDMISFGPDIRGAHAPGEKVEIESVARCWQLLKAVLQELAKV